MKIVVTGAGGFVGRPLCGRLSAAGHDVTGLVRSEPQPSRAAYRIVSVGDIAARQEWRELLAVAECVVHLAARTHAHDTPGQQTEALYEAANVTATESLVRASREAGVKRFVYVSSIKVNGEATFGTPFRPDDTPAPQDAYGRSKAKAERTLSETAGPGLETVILRPPLMYGPGVRGNLAQLFHWAARGWPLPIGSIENRRDILGVTNFVDLLAEAVVNPAAAGRTLLARDGASVSTPALYAAVCDALGVKPRMLPCPVSLLRGIGRATGRSEAVHKLVGDLEIDDSATRRLLGWRPSTTLRDELAATARALASK